jgi:peptidoglycan/xylan/chitin deacetylase (PgdA/CDA1 family)
MRIRFSVAVSALAALVILAAGCTVFGNADATSVSVRMNTAQTSAATAGASTTWMMAPSLVGTEWEKLPTAKNLVALTFDAGSGDEGVASIVATLEEKNVPATFFLTGKWAEKFPDEAMAIASKYPVGSHTYSHPHLPTLSDSGIVSEVKGGAQAIRVATGVDTRPLFRFPYGDRNANVIGIVNGLGYGSIRWTVDTLGWEGVSGGQSVDTVQSRILAALTPGEIVLMHVGAANDGTTLDADALAGAIDAIRAHGYGFTNVYRFAARYANVADDGTARFSASSAWKTSTSSPERYGKSSHHASPAAIFDPAGFRLRAPQTVKYRLYAWWPVSALYSPAATVKVKTLGGSRSFVVDQSATGGGWVRLGKVTLRAGDGWSVSVLRRSSRAGQIVADAFRLTSLTPP